MAEFLFECYSEELPVSMQAPMAEYLANAFEKLGESYQIAMKKTHFYYGSRRLVVHIPSLPLQTALRHEQRRGPKVGAAPQALEGFLKSTGLTQDQLTIEETPKGSFYNVNIVHKAQNVADLLAQDIPDILHKMPWAKSMRWGANTIRWGRPLHVILAIISEGSETYPLDFSYGHIRSGDHTYGHFFTHSHAIKVKNFADYHALLSENHVIFNPPERIGLMQDALHHYAQKHDLTVIEDKGLIAEVSGLVEMPVLIVGKIAENFQQLPPEVLKTSMRTHQKFFSLQNSSKKIVRFATFANSESYDKDLILQGNQRVLTARLKDAEYFYTQDKAISLDDHLQKLSNVIYHNRLGTQLQRVQRLQTLSVLLANHVQISSSDALRVATLAKADLTTQMVGEFPELQGIMGQYYALHAGEKPEIAAAIAQHYAPKGASDTVPESLLGAIVALADKLDQLAGFWVMQEKPTSSKDPYALRRAALGALRIVTHYQISLPLAVFLKEAVLLNQEDYLLENKQTPDEIVADLQNFIHDRYRVYLKEILLGDSRLGLLEAMDVFADCQDDYAFLHDHISILNDFFKHPLAEELLQSYQRIFNILEQSAKKNLIDTDFVVNKIHFIEPSEENLHQVAETVAQMVKNHLTSKQYALALSELVKLQSVIIRFFDHVMIHANEQHLQQNRLALLGYVRDVMHLCANFSKMIG